MITQQQEIYVQALARGKTQRKAYYEAYPHSKKWKESSVDNKASALKRKPEIKARYEELLHKAAERTEDDTLSMTQFLIEEYKAIANADIGDFYETAVDEDGRVTLDIVDLSKVDTRAIQEISFTNGNKVRVKLYSKTDAMKALADIYHINNEQVDAEIKVTFSDEFEGMAD